MVATALSKALPAELVAGFATGNIVIPESVLRASLKLSMLRSDFELTEFQCLEDHWRMVIGGDIGVGPAKALKLQSVTLEVRIEAIRFDSQTQEIDIRLLGTELLGKNQTDRILLWIINAFLAGLVERKIQEAIPAATDTRSITIHPHRDDLQLFTIDLSNHPTIQKLKSISLGLLKGEGLLQYLNVETIFHERHGLRLKTHGDRIL